MYVHSTSTYALWNQLTHNYTVFFKADSESLIISDFL
jgi:hypothetical protein